MKSRLEWLILVGLCASACSRGGQDAADGRSKPDACITPAAEEVTRRPDFEAAYTYCAKGSRAIGGPATIACLEERAGLPEECGQCYSWYKACVLRHCFKACFTTRPEPICLLCRRNFCQGQFSRCAGTGDVFPGSTK